MFDSLCKTYSNSIKNQRNTNLGKRAYFCKKNGALKTIIGLILLVLLSNSYVLNTFYPSSPEKEILELSEKGEKETKNEDKEVEDENKLHFHSVFLLNKMNNNNSYLIGIGFNSLNWKEYFKEIKTPPPQFS